MVLGSAGDALADPTITFRFTHITGTPQSFEATGDLTIKGRTHPVTVHGSADPDGTLRGSASFTQSTWGIKPYTAFLGALKLADEVRMEFICPGVATR